MEYSYGKLARFSAFPILTREKVNGEFKIATAVQFLVLFSLLYANAVLLRRKPIGPLDKTEDKIVHLPTRFFLVLSLNVLIGLSVV